MGLLRRWPGLCFEQRAMMLGDLATLFFGALATNVAMAVVPHEPIVILYGARLGVWLAALVATAGTVVACIIDYLVILPRLRRWLDTPRAHRTLATPTRWFVRAPFATLALSGLTPLPFWPFKLLVLVSRYPLSRFIAAVALGRLPRHLLLAWLGVSLSLPPWSVALVFAVLLAAGLGRRALGAAVSAPRRAHEEE